MSVVNIKTFQRYLEKIKPKDFDCLTTHKLKLEKTKKYLKKLNYKIERIKEKIENYHNFDIHLSIFGKRSITYKKSLYANINELKKAYDNAKKYLKELNKNPSKSFDTTLPKDKHNQNSDLEEIKKLKKNLKKNIEELYDWAEKNRKIGIIKKIFLSIFSSKVNIFKRPKNAFKNHLSEFLGLSNAFKKKLKRRSIQREKVLYKFNDFLFNLLNTDKYTIKTSFFATRKVVYLDSSISFQELTDLFIKLLKKSSSEDLEVINNIEKKLVDLYEKINDKICYKATFFFSFIRSFFEKNINNLLKYLIFFKIGITDTFDIEDISIQNTKSILDNLDKLLTHILEHKKDPISTTIMARKKITFLHYSVNINMIARIYKSIDKKTKGYYPKLKAQIGRKIFEIYNLADIQIEDHLIKRIFRFFKSFIYNYDYYFNLFKKHKLKLVLTEGNANNIFKKINFLLGKIKQNGLDCNPKKGFFVTGKYLRPKKRSVSKDGNDYTQTKSSTKKRDLKKGKHSKKDFSSISETIVRRDCFGTPYIIVNNEKINALTFFNDLNKILQDLQNMIDDKKSDLKGISTMEMHHSEDIDLKIRAIFLHFDEVSSTMKKIIFARFYINNEEKLLAMIRSRYRYLKTTGSSVNYLSITLNTIHKLKIVNDNSRLMKSIVFDDDKDDED